MLRRDIFNLIFNKKPDNGSAAPLPNLVIGEREDAARLQDAGYYREWTAPFLPHTFLPEFSASYSFTLILQTQHTPAFLQLGKVKLGVDKGYLFIAGLTGKRAIELGDDDTGFKLVLTVRPQPNGFSYAKLVVIDQYGLTLATLKSTTHTPADWNGLITLHTTLNALHIEGIRSSFTEPNPITTI